MLNHNASSSEKKTLNPKNIKWIDRIYRCCLPIIPLTTAAVCWSNSNQPVLALDIDGQTNKVTFSHLSLGQDDINHDEHDDSSLHHHNSSGLIPRILSFIAAPFQTHLNYLAQANFPNGDSQEAQYKEGVGGSFTQNLAPIYLSQAVSSSAKEFSLTTKIQSIESRQNLELLAIAPKAELYTVQRGDTVNLIADKYQISSQELIALNKIQDSNVILTDQKLKLPVNSLAKIQPAKIAITKTNFPQNSQTEVEQSIDNISADDLQKKRLANLRADINQMRSEIKRERDSFRLNATKVDLASSANLEENQDFDVILEESISVKLPPLPSSEEYLPEAFDGYSWPAQGVLSSGYGWRWGRLHKGIDIAAPVGTPIFAAAAGEVVSAGWNSGGYGNLVKLEHLDGSITLYAHNNRILVNRGQRVSKGQQIAEMGNTGFSTGSHLHFEIHSRNRGVVNPLALLKK